MKLTALAPSQTYTRVLNPNALDSIRYELSALNFSVVNNYENVDERWHVIKRIIVSIVDKFAPLKSIRPKKRDRYPWVDAELHFHLAFRDKLMQFVLIPTQTDLIQWNGPNSEPRETLLKKCFERK